MVEHKSRKEGEANMNECEEYELMTIELDLEHPAMNVRIRRRMDSITLKRVERVLQDNADIFAW